MPRRIPHPREQHRQHHTTMQKYCTGNTTLAHPPHRLPPLLLTIPADRSLFPSRLPRRLHSDTAGPSAIGPTRALPRCLAVRFDEIAFLPLLPQTRPGLICPHPYLHEISGNGHQTDSPSPGSRKNSITTLLRCVTRIPESDPRGKESYRCRRATCWGRWWGK